jgi:hypothetical protein
MGNVTFQREISVEHFHRLSAKRANNFNLMQRETLLVDGDGLI